MNTGPRSMLVVAHTGRAESVEAAREVIDGLRAGGIVPAVVASERDDLVAVDPGLADLAVLGREVQPSDLETVIVLGGDGTILRAAEIVRDEAVPIIGVNLGHVGFLAEAEREALPETVRRVIERDYEVEERMALDVVVTLDGEELGSTWALNEATVEKSTNGRMIEVGIEVNGIPLSSFGCDGVVLSTPTGSTAYAFSGGGPVVWPNIEALLIVPLAAHALFARPLVVSPDSTVAVEVLHRTPTTGMLWCDGRRSIVLPPGARVTVTGSRLPVRLARMHRGLFTQRLVRKFDLPVSGWRGPVRPGDAGSARSSGLG